MKNFFDLNLYDTPIIQIPFENNDLYIKRDDLIPFSFGGNKVRIALEFIKDMYVRGMNCMVGYGSSHSNLSRALANLCYQLKIPCHIVSPDNDDGTRSETFNSKLVSLCGAYYHYCTRDNVRNTVDGVINELEKQGLRPYYIYGNAEGKGNGHIPIKAYQKIYEKIKGKFDYIFLPTGTGMTQSGFLVGKSLFLGEEKIIGISVARDSSYEIEVIKKMIQEYNDKVACVKVCDINVEDSYRCNGYGSFNEDIERIINEQMMLNGMPLDPVYTGKAFWGMTDYLKRHNITGKKILFLHTGGVPLFFDYLRGLSLREIKDLSVIKETICCLEKNIIPSLKERNINLEAYAEKLYKFGRVWTHYCEGKAVSIIGGYCNNQKDYTAYISIIIVDKFYQHRHLGSSLLALFEKYALDCGMKFVKLEVRKNNNSAICFYNKHGYNIVNDASEESFYMIKKIGNI